MPVYGDHTLQSCYILRYNLGMQMGKSLFLAQVSGTYFVHDGFGEQLVTIYFHNISSYVEIMTYGEFQLPMMSSNNYSGLRRVRSQI